jgi:large subunit ribosomal protein L25
MLSLSAKIRKETGKKSQSLRDKGLLPAVLYGPKLKNINLAVDLKAFQNALNEAGESTLVQLEIDGAKEKYLVLIHDLIRDPLTDFPIHVDFYQPSLKKEILAKIPIILDGEAPAVKNLGGTLIKNINEVEVKALPELLPKEIRVDVSSLDTFEKHILVKDLKVAEGVKIQRGLEEIVARVSPVEKVEEDLAKPVEEKVEEVEKIEKKVKEEVVEEEPKEKSKEAAK